jgi:hypothetical protein
MLAPLRLMDDLTPSQFVGSWCRVCRTVVWAPAVWTEATGRRGGAVSAPAAVIPPAA